ncbi:MAG: hypothetical protein BM564_01120 [Bacteroidetes bacterium MedPE-SWsnd-G2]|mgnify:CR=1 FL=1|nr:MAG: hypothetical protein BM564_01120 [Bacteroidetes bacterium MedPE-SWsnd-G2]
MKSLTLILSIIICMPLFSQTDIEGVLVPNTKTVASKTLQLNGAGVREKMWIDLYVGALFLEQKSNNPETITGMDKAMAMDLTIISSLITSEKMVDAVNEGFKYSTKGHPEKLQSEITQLLNVFRTPITQGDHYSFVYLPNKGTEVIKNGISAIIIPGLDFKQALFGIWLCDKPADKNLKKGLLGH